MKRKTKVFSQLDPNHELFEFLRSSPPFWWKNIASDRELYVEIRKDNYIDVYHKGGALMKLNWANGKPKAVIHSEYVPLRNKEKYQPFSFSGGHISLDTAHVIDVNDFDESARKKIKKRICLFNPKNSEKAIQGEYVVSSNAGRGEKNGFFIDSELQDPITKSGRIDLVWVDIPTKQLVLIELKKIDDPRLTLPRSKKPETIDVQLEKYLAFVKANKKDLLDHYQRVFEIKKSLGLLPSFITIDNLNGFTILERPILLVGDCNQPWIDLNHLTINKRIEGIAFGCVYRGITTHYFRLPMKTSGNLYRLP